MIVHDNDNIDDNDNDAMYHVISMDSDRRDFDLVWPFVGYHIPQSSTNSIRKCHLGPFRSLANNNTSINYETRNSHAKLILSAKWDLADETQIPTCPDVTIYLSNM